MTSPQDTGGASRPTQTQEAQTQEAQTATPQEPVSAVESQPGTSVPAHHRLHRTRLGGVWVGLTLAAVVLVLLLVFILENGQRASISYFGAHGHLPLGVALLLAAVAGALVAMIVASGRIMQLRRAARRHRRIDSARPGAVPPSGQD